MWDYRNRNKNKTLKTTRKLLKNLKSWHEKEKLAQKIKQIEGEDVYIYVQTQNLKDFVTNTK